MNLFNIISPGRPQANRRRIRRFTVERPLWNGNAYACRKFYHSPAVCPEFSRSNRTFGILSPAKSGVAGPNEKVAIGTMGLGGAGTLLATALNLTLDSMRSVKRALATKRHSNVSFLLGIALRVWAIAAAMSCARAAVFDLQTATVADIQEAMKAGALTSEKLVQLYLNRIDAYDKRGPKINAIITLNPRALNEARALDAERKAKGPRSQLHGVPVLFKDLIDVAALPTTAGFIPFGAPVPHRDATLVGRLRAAGVVVLGKASTYNWFGKGYETHPIGATLNPYNLLHITGGTSNGSAAAMAACFATLAVGTDTSASVLYPSACCGVTGMLGTQGMVSRAGIIPNGATMDRAGSMGRSVYDVTALFSAMAGWDAEDLITFRSMGRFPQSDWSKELQVADLAGRRLGVLREMIYGGSAHAEGRAIFERALGDLRKGGAVVVDPVLTGIDLKTQSLGGENRTAEYEKIAFINAYLARLGPAAKFKTVDEMIEKVGREKLANSLVAALELPPPEKSPVYLARYRTREMFIRLFQEVMDRFALDALVLPYRTIPPERVGEPHDPEATNQLTSHFGAPAVVVPGGYAQGNLPIAIQFFGRHNDDLTVLKIAHAYERVSRRQRTPASTPPLPGERFEYNVPPSKE